MQLEHIAHRARILARQTIPEHLTRLSKSHKGSDLTKIINQCENRLTKFNKDYDEYNNSVIPYEQFYLLYGGGGGQTKDFSRKKFSSPEVIYMNIEPDVVNIIQAGPTKVFRSAAKTPVTIQRGDRDR